MPKVVILEDDHRTRDILTQMLVMSGYEILSFSEPHMCPVYASATCVCPQDSACGDFLITDNCMPRISGLDFIQQQQSRGCKGIGKNKAIMSGNWSAENLAMAEKLECKVFYKPVNFKEILTWLEERSSETCQVAEATPG